MGRLTEIDTSPPSFTSIVAARKVALAKLFETYAQKHRGDHPWLSQLAQIHSNRVALECDVATRYRERNFPELVERALAKLEGRKPRELFDIPEDEDED